MANNRTTAHVISHTHWDREWYMPYEKHHVRLVELMDSLLELLERDPEYKSFHLDGQTIVLEDYLQIRPEKKERIVRFVREGRLQVGPWYILQDEFLTSSEANVRNLLIGLKDAAAFGNACAIGYFPDSFGNMGQAPQLLRQAGIDNAIFGRGVTPTGFNNKVADGAAYESPFSEMIWQSPDGSEVLGILFANWYNNGMEVPADAEEAKRYWTRKLEEAKRFASTPQLLFMNGCDHQPVQTDLSEALRTARRLFPDTDFVHSDFPTYLSALKDSLPEGLSVIKGELRSQQTDGWSDLVNTASARMYIKQDNHRGQVLLEKVAEPLAAFASWHAGAEYPHHLFAYAWKTLMQNHPHDSICGCSVDEVHREMMARFAKSRHVAESIVDRSAEALVASIDARFAGNDAYAFTVFNMSGWERTGVVEAELDVARIPVDYGKMSSVVARLKEISVAGGIVVDSEGREYPAKLEDSGVRFGYELPEDRFRQPYLARRVLVTFQAEGVPALGYRTYALKLNDRSVAEKGDEWPDLRVMENEWLRAVVNPNGSIELTDKRSGRTFKELVVYEDCGDIGNEYMFKQPDGEKPLDTRDLTAEVTRLEASAYRTVLEIVHDWAVPAEADETLEREQRELVEFQRRQAKRIERTVPLAIRTIVTLENGLPYLKVRTTFVNHAKDHRVRVLFPTLIETSKHRADSIFEVAERGNKPAAVWTNPSHCRHQQSFVNVSDDSAGLTIANLGLPEYEIVPDDRNTIALTLLRSVGELGDWGYFPTPDAQCLGEHTAEFAIIPHGDRDSRLESFAHAYQLQIPWTIRQHGAAAGEGNLPAAGAFAEWTGSAMALSAVKRSERTGDLIARWFNMTEEPAELAVRVEGTAGVYKSSIVEDVGDAISLSESGSHALPVGKHEIVSVGVKR